MSLHKQLLWVLLILATSQIIGQLLPPFSMSFGTNFLIPSLTLLICFVPPNKTACFDFEKKATIVILTTALSAILDYFYAPGTHDQVGFAWMTLYWSFGLFVLFFGLIVAKLFSDFSFTKIGVNLWTLLTILELTLFTSVPLLYHKLLWTGKIVPIIGNC